VAAYLRAGADERPAADKLLEKLALPQAATVVEAKKSAPASEPKVDEKKLDAMARPEPAAPAKKPDQEQKPVDLSKVDEKLSSLLGDKK